MDLYILLMLLLILTNCKGSSDCDSFKDCVTCTAHSSWIGSHCRWCPLDRECHAFGSLKNTCLKDQNLVSASLCPDLSVSNGVYNPKVAYLATLLSALAYSDEPDKCIDKTLSDDGFELLEAIGQRCEDFHLFEYKECYAYTAVSHKMETIVLAYRGTTTTTGNKQLYDEILSVLLKPKEHFLIGGEVQYYFKNVFNKLSPCVHESIKTRLTYYPDYNVLVTGHSLGGAIASLSAAALVYLGIVQKDRLSLYTFGMPRVGDKGYALKHDEIVNNSWRVVHARDIVAHLPTCNPVLGCRVTTNGPYHHGIEIFYPDSDMTTSSNYIQCNGNEDHRCSDGTITANWCVKDLDTCIRYHKYYFSIPVGTLCSNLGAGRKRRASDRSLMWERLSSKKCTRINLTNFNITASYNETGLLSGKQNSSITTEGSTSAASRMYGNWLFFIMLLSYEKF